MAEWKTTYSGTPYCTNCNMSNFNTPNVCPHCNVRMNNYIRETVRRGVNYKKEFHLWFNEDYEPAVISNTYNCTERLIESNASIIHTTQVMCVSTRLFDLGYRIFIHCKDTSTFEITLGGCERTDREIRMGHCLSKMLVNGAFGDIL